MMTIEEFFREVPRAAVAFSGGTDSALVLYLAKKYGCKVHAYYAKTAFQPGFELKDALRLAGELEVPVTVIEKDILAVSGTAANGPDRCYYCKRELFTAIKSAAEKDGYKVLLDGSNASDDEGDRPGMRALKELHVRSPLRECGIEKREVRRISREAGLFTWEKPAYACLATRIPAGVLITEQKLEKIEQAENLLGEMGFSDFRVRLAGDAARIQVTENQLELAVGKREQITEQLKPFFSAVLLDLETRRGSILKKENGTYE